ncbi:hypothetical protein LCM10_04035 [Rossellomorea aquimaris]|uniref:hypothetical protein n=1 Tax=Rossellomorea aquimaris TaxID=189382 RepID=UPI001CD28648|nr:hypothetical protein [Rossellomorea aquimaris]MCA1054146.1 hypothetical protein [Rossellomorea aquimaris]
MFLLFYAFVFHLLNFTNIALVDFDEEPIVFREAWFLISIVAVAVFFFFYFKYLTGSKTYRKVKEVVWSIFFGSTALFCTMWLWMCYVMYKEELIVNYFVLGLYIMVLMGLAVLSVRKFKQEG